MLKRRSKSKQSKFLTIMLIPDAHSKVKSLKIPHWLLYSTTCMCAVVFTAIGITKFQSNYFQNEYQKSNDKLLESEKKIEIIEVEKDLLKSSFEEEKEKLIGENQLVNQNFNDFEAKIEDLESKIDEIQKIKEDIYDKMSVLEDKGAPVSVANLSSDNYDVNAMGGPYVPLDDTSTFSLRITSLEAKLNNEIVILNEYKKAAKDIEPFLLAYPTGWPTQGIITSRFGERADPFGGSTYEYHTGLDIAVPTGTPVYATGNGVVEFAGNMSGYGYLVILDHSYGYSTYYAHNSKLLVENGEMVERGDTIALSGNTGRSTGPHVHYEVRANNIPQNPSDYIDEL